MNFPSLFNYIGTATSVHSPSSLGLFFLLTETSAIKKTLSLATEMFLCFQSESLSLVDIFEISSSFPGDLATQGPFRPACKSKPGLQLLHAEGC